MGKCLGFLNAVLMLHAFSMLGCSTQAETPAVPAQSLFGDPPAEAISARRRAVPSTNPVPRTIVAEGRATLIYPVRHGSADVLRDAAEGMISPEGSTQGLAGASAVVVTDRSEVIAGIEALLVQLDQPIPQLLVEARVLEVTLDRDLEYEVSHLLSVAAASGGVVRSSEVVLDTPGALPNPTQGGLLAIRSWDTGDELLESFVRLLLTRGQARILSSPNVIVSTGNTASIITGEEVPVQNSIVTGGTVQTTTQFRQVGVKLRVHVLQITDGTALLEINPEVSAVTGSTGGSELTPANPIIAIRSVTSTLSLHDGEILTIGGLLRDEQRELTRGLPVLQDLPLIGALFQSRREQSVKTQLVFFLRCHILPMGDYGAVRVHRPGDAIQGLDDTIRLDPREGADE